MKTEPRQSRTDLNTVKRSLQQEAIRRNKAEDSLRKIQNKYAQLFAQSGQMQKQLRQLSHQVLFAQEEERKHISRELHDEISQMLTGINVRLAALKIENAANTVSLKKKITTTQRLVEKSVATIHRFACELRPPMLDDLGLMPALQSFIKEFRKRTGLQVRLKDGITGKIEQLNGVKKTVLYRVAQEALTNVAKHAKSSRVECSLQVKNNFIYMKICDNGKSFELDKVFMPKRRKCLGIVGMRERVEMVGGNFAIESVAGKGTTVRVHIPLGNGKKE